jgi:APA family basic amino acid/polyamine antiporter
LQFDAVSNAAEECRHPQKNLPIGILASLGVCALLYAALSLVLCGVVPAAHLDPTAPLTAAFDGKGAPLFAMPWICS